MSRNHKVSRQRLAGLAACAMLAAVGWLVPRLLPAPRIGSAAVASLRAERDTLAGNTNAVRDALRRQAAAKESPEWDERRIAQLQTALGPEWQWSTDTTVGSGGRRFTVSALALELERWPAHLAAIEQIERQPGLVVERVEIAATGAGGARKFVRIALTLRLPKPRARTPGNKERAAALTARSLFRRPRRRHGGERSRVSFCAPPAVRLRLPTGLRSGENTRPFLHGPHAVQSNVSQSNPP